MTISFTVFFTFLSYSLSNPGDPGILPNTLIGVVYEENEYNREDVYQFVFNQGTVLEGSEELQAQVMENGKNPGLGVRAIHEQGITGKGVNVAVIDQPLLPDHPQFAGKIAAYYDTGCG